MAYFTIDVSRASSRYPKSDSSSAFHLVNDIQSASIDSPNAMVNASRIFKGDTFSPRRIVLERSY